MFPLIDNFQTEIWFIWLETEFCICTPVARGRQFVEFDIEKVRFSMWITSDKERVFKSWYYQIPLSLIGISSISQCAGPIQPLVCVLSHLSPASTSLSILCFAVTCFAPLLSVLIFGFPLPCSPPWFLPLIRSVTLPVGPPWFLMGLFKIVFRGQGTALEFLWDKEALKNRRITFSVK